MKMPSFATWWRSFWTKWKSSSARREAEAPSGAASPTSLHPDVIRLHETLDRIHDATPRARSLDEERTLARARRKAMERRAAELLPDADIDPDDTGEMVVRIA